MKYILAIAALAAIGGFFYMNQTSVSSEVET